MPAMKTVHTPSLSDHPITALRIRRILVPIDFSEAGQQALEYARVFAGLTGASVRLVHVLELTYLATLPYGGGELAYAQFDRDRLREVITRQIGAIQAEGLGGIRTSFEVREGVAHREIAAAAKAEKTDLIIMGARGHGRLERVLLGSTAERVVRLAPCPVLVVKSEVSPEPRKTTRRRKVASSP